MNETVFDNGPVVVQMVSRGSVCIDVEGQRIYLKPKELTDIAEAVARHLKCEGCGNQGSAALFRTNPASGNALCTACEGYDDAPD